VSTSGAFTAALKRFIARRGLKQREYCKQKCKENRILTVSSLYVLEVLCFIKKYKGSFKQNFVINERNTTSKYDLHTQFCNTPLFQKSIINMGIKLYKYWPSEIKEKYIISIALVKK
jgi:hypothetical protein